MKLATLKSPILFKTDYSKANFQSIGCSNRKKHKCDKKLCKYGGNFFYQNLDDLYLFILHHNYTKKYCFSELKTTYFKLFWDFDIDGQMLDNLKENNNNFDSNNFFDYIISKIVNSLKYYIDIESDNQLDYIYCDRTDNLPKIHLYFPNLIVNKSYALVIRNKTIVNILEDNIFNLSINQINKIIDPSVFQSNGIRLPFQTKQGQTAYYKINTQKSVWKNIPKDYLEQLKLLSVRTNNLDINFVTNKNENLLSFLDDDKDKIFSPAKIQKFIKIIMDCEIHKKNTECNEPNELQIESVNVNLFWELLDNLSIERLINFISWKPIIFLCKNYKLNDHAHNISKKAHNYDFNKTEELLNAKNNFELQYTISSLYFWSNHDNPEKHKEIIKNISK